MRKRRNGACLSARMHETPARRDHDERGPEARLRIARGRTGRDVRCPGWVRLRVPAQADQRFRSMPINEPLPETGRSDRVGAVLAALALRPRHLQIPQWRRIDSDCRNCSSTFATAGRWHLDLSLGVQTGVAPVTVPKRKGAREFSSPLLHGSV